MTGKRLIAAISVPICALLLGSVASGPSEGLPSTASGTDPSSAPSSLTIPSTSDAVGLKRELNPDALTPQRPALDALVESGIQNGLTANQAVANFLAALPASAPTSANDTPILDDLTRPDLSGMLSFAIAQGESVVDVVKLHGGDIALNAALTKVGAAAPDNYLGAVLPGDGSPPVVVFGNTAPSTAVDALAALGRPIYIEEQVGVTRPELSSAQENAFANLNAIGAKCTLYFALADREWTVTCDQGAVSIGGISSAVDSLSEIAPVHVDTTRLPTTAADQVIRGGALLNGNVGCTSGFVLTNTNTGAHRLATAGHCVYDNGASSKFTYSNHSAYDTGSVNLGVASWNYGPNDWAALYVGGSQGWTPAPVFFYDLNLTRSVYSQMTSLPAVYSQTCHYGKTTGYSCGEFLGCWVDVTYTDDPYHPALSNLCLSYRSTVDHGDSGGPVFAGSVADGTTSGMNDASQGNKYLYWEPMWSYPSRFTVYKVATP